MLNGGTELTSAAAQFESLNDYANDPDPVLLIEDEDGDGVTMSHEVFVDQITYWQSVPRTDPSSSPLLLYQVTAFEAEPA